ncbi:MAG: hypothetical protein KJ060_00690 [Candidatus Hydrogenedentes bacterium]|nr:hypothetical protein [Candidatus Hydrogenedentota bacterium]
MSRARNRKLIKITLVLGVLGFAYWCVVGYTLPVYHYESSDRGMAALEVPWKGLHFDNVQPRFDEYKAATGNSTATLCRTDTRNWTDPHLWWENLTHPRWDLPYIPPSENPNYHYSTNQPANLQSASAHEG